MTGQSDGPLALPVPAAFSLTNVTVPVCRSQRNTSLVPLLSLGTKLDAVAKTKKRPSLLHCEGLWIGTALGQVKRLEPPIKFQTDNWFPVS